jgi:hypothetical protein
VSAGVVSEPDEARGPDQSSLATHDFGLLVTLQVSFTVPPTCTLPWSALSVTTGLFSPEVPPTPKTSPAPGREFLFLIVPSTAAFAIDSAVVILCDFLNLLLFASVVATAITTMLATITIAATAVNILVCLGPKEGNLGILLKSGDLGGSIFTITGSRAIRYNLTKTG